MNILADSVKELRIESRYTPALIIRDPFAASPPSPIASAVGTFLRPRITAVTAFGPIASAPYGEPGPSRWPAVQGALMISAALSAVWIASKFINR
jgi:hypothetical protein